MIENEINKSEANINERPAYIPPEQRAENIEQVLDPTSEAIAATTNPSELYQVIEQLGPINGQDTKGIINYIRAFLEGRVGSNYITRTYGIRAKAEELFRPAVDTPVETPVESANPDSVTPIEASAEHWGYPGAGRFEERKPLGLQQHPSNGLWDTEKQ